MKRLFFILAFAFYYNAFSSEPPKVCQNDFKPIVVHDETRGEKLMNPMLKMSLIQFPIENSKTLEQFLSKVGTYLDRAGAEGSELIVFPELFILDMVSRSNPTQEATELRRMAEVDTPRIVEFFKREARNRNKTILGGTIPRYVNGDIRNTAYLFFPSGRVVEQDKIFLTPDEVNWGWKGGDTLKMFNTPWGKTSILICYDCQFAAFSQELAKYSPDVILIPSMTGNKGFFRVRWAAQARAVELHAYVALTGTVDAIRGTDYVGQGVFITPSEEGFEGILSEGRMNQDDIVTTTLDIEKLRLSKKEAGIFSGRDNEERETPINYVIEGE